MRKLAFRGKLSQLPEDHWDGILAASSPQGDDEVVQRGGRGPILPHSLEIPTLVPFGLVHGLCQGFKARVVIEHAKHMGVPELGGFVLGFFPSFAHQGGGSFRVDEHLGDS